MATGCNPVPQPSCDAERKEEYTYTWTSNVEGAELVMKTYMVVIENYNHNGGMQVEEVKAAKYEIDQTCQYVNFYDDTGEMVASISNNGIKIIRIAPE